MSVYFNPSSIPPFRNAVLTIGTFDGVHFGHRKILHEVVKKEEEVKGESVVITFDPHPRKLLFPESSLQLLTPLEDKLRLIEQTGIDHIVVVPFTKEFSELSAEGYISDFLVAKFHPRVIVIGYDHHFGHDRQGNIGLLKKAQHQYGFTVEEIEPQLIDEAAVSSTKIRKALQHGQVHEAAQMLGRDYTLSAKVIEGKKIGRTLGYPTANLQPLDADQLIPAHGIYAVRANIHGKEKGGMLSIGYNPTVSQEKKVHVEVHLFDFHEEIYGKKIRISFAGWLRKEEQFDSLETMRLQLQQDEQNAKILLSQA